MKLNTTSVGRRLSRLRLGRFSSVQRLAAIAHNAICAVARADSAAITKQFISHVTCVYSIHVYTNRLLAHEGKGVEVLFILLPRS